MDRLVVSSVPRYNARHPAHIGNRDREPIDLLDQSRRDHFPCSCCGELIPDYLMEGDRFVDFGPMK